MGKKVLRTATARTPATPRLLVAQVATEAGILICDVLQTESQRWLVPYWYEGNSGQVQTPGRAIRLDGLDFQWTGLGQVDLTVATPLPKALFEAHAPARTDTQYEVVEGPSDRFGWIPVRMTQ